MCLLISAAGHAQSRPPLTSPLFKTSQEAVRLVALTRPGYYKALLVPDWRAKKVNSDRAVTAAASLCRRAQAPAESPVPLQLKGERLDEKQVQLTWETSNALTDYTVEIERSLSPAEGFETVTSVRTARPAAPVVTQQTIDPNAYAGLSYYRLKRVEPMGAPTYSQTVAMKGELRPLTVKAFPNPGQLQHVRFEVTNAGATEPVSVILYDVQGRILYQNEQANLDDERQFGLPAALGFVPGHYYMTIITREQRAETSFIVQP